ncbi:TIGR00153 family protein [Marinicella sp. W31]|uniref:TIGR00153 family protein n=1 Tax=Marinicella sp. W31 TaxID=3023713 RepID=UPI003756D530
MGNIISDLLGHSPVKPIQEHIQIAHNAAKLLPELFDAAYLNDWNKVDETVEQIKQLENDADDAKLSIRSNLPKSLFMPVPRQDLLELLLAQDQVANLSKYIASLVQGRKMQIPEQLMEDFRRFVSRCVDAVKKAKQSVNELDELYESGFRGAEVELVQKLVNKLDQIESETDEMQSQLRSSLFQIEDTLPPVNVIFLYKIIDSVSAVADVAERIGRRLELLLAK